MKQIRLMSKLGLALMIAITTISVAVATHAYNIQTADAQARLPNNSVTSQTIVDGTIQERDIADGVIPDGGGVQPTVHVVEIADSMPPHTSTRVDADCPDGEIMTGGGFNSSPPLGFEQDLVIIGSHPEQGGWVVTARNLGDSSIGVNAFAICMDFSP